MNPAGELVAQLWHVPLRPYWLAIRLGDRFTQKPVAGTLEELAQRIAGWMADIQRVAASQPDRALPLVGGGPRAAVPTPPAPTPTAPTPTAPTPPAPTPNSADSGRVDSRCADSPRAARVPGDEPDLFPRRGAGA